MLHRKVLDLQQVTITGREKELGVLLNVSESFARSPSSRSMLTHSPARVYIEGNEGVGKSFLMDFWREKCTLPMFRGSFDSSSNCPFDGLLQVLDELLNHVDPDLLRDTYESEQGTKYREIPKLYSLMPRLRKILSRQVVTSLPECPLRRATSSSGEDDESSAEISLGSSGDFFDDPLSKTSTNFKLEADQINFAVRELLLCAQQTQRREPFVVFLDDIHWADENSLDVITSFISDRSLDGILVVLASRPVVSDSNFALAAEECVRESGLTWNRIDLTNLTLEQVNQIVTVVTELSPPTTMPLTQIIYEKTKGNPYFVLQFLRVLENRNLLSYSMTKYRWCWDEAEVRAQTDLADNVAAVVLERLRFLDGRLQHILQYAAYLGSVFDLHHLASVVQGMDMLPDGRPSSLQRRIHFVTKTLPLESVASSLEGAVACGLIEAVGRYQYKFAHSSVQQSFLDREVSNVFLYRMGYVLLSLFRSRGGRNWMLFAAMHTLNQVSSSDDCGGGSVTGRDDAGRTKTTTKDEQENGEEQDDVGERRMLSMVILNMQAGQKALDLYAFFPASSYLGAGVERMNALKDDPWERRYGLALQLTTLAMRVDLACGRHQRVEELSQMLLKRGRSLEDKMEAYVSRTKSLQAQSKTEEGFQVLLEGLRKCGERFPKRPDLFSRTWFDRQAKRVLRKKTDADILALPIIEDQLTNFKMKLMSMAILNSYYRYREDWMILIMRRLVCRTIEWGLSKYAPLGFAVYARKLAFRGDILEATRFGKIADALIRKLQVKKDLAVTTFFLAAFVDHLKSPMFSSLKTLKRGFDVGMELGDREGAFLCASATLGVKTALGTPLNDLFEESKTLLYLAKEYHQSNLIPEFLIMCQYTANLQGKTSDPITFDGAIMDERKMMYDIIHPDEENKIPHFYTLLRAMLLLFMGRWDEAAEAMEGVYVLLHKYAFMNATHYNIPLALVYCAVTFYGHYRTTEDTKMLAKAEFSRKILRSWGEKGALNVAALLWFADAQRAKVDGQDFETVKAAFDKAISGLRRCGLRCLQALACELFADYAAEHDDTLWASDYYERSRDLYAEWGAWVKVQQLEGDHPNIFGESPAEQAPRSSDSNCRQRLSGGGSASPEAGTSWWSPSVRYSFDEDESLHDSRGNSSSWQQSFREED